MAHTDSHSCAHVNTSRAQARTNADDTALEQRIASLVNKSTAELVKVGHTPLPQLRGAAVVAHQRARTNTLTHVCARAHACTPAHPIQRTTSLETSLHEIQKTTNQIKSLLISNAYGDPPANS